MTAATATWSVCRCGQRSSCFERRMWTCRLSPKLTFCPNARCVLCGPKRYNSPPRLPSNERSDMALEFVPAKPEHTGELGRICYEAFKDISDRHHFSSDFTSAAMVRLLQDSFNMTSLSLYASLGFDTKEPVAVMQPSPGDRPDESVRAVTEADLEEVAELSRQIYKVSRRNEVASGITGPFRPFLRERNGRIAGYYILGIAGHGVAETEDDLVALVRETARQMPPDFHRVLCPLTEGDLYRKLLANGCRNIKVMNLMALGPYERPDGAWIPSVLY